MKSRRRGLLAAIRLFPALLLMCSAIAHAGPQPSLPGSAPATAPAPSAGFDPASIYQLGSSWTRSDGKVLTLGSLRGKVRVLAIFYASCQYACPIIVGRMKSVEAALPENVRDQVGYVLVTMDPANDTVPKLVEYTRRLELEGDWSLLRGSDGDVRELAALLNFRYRQEADGGFSHSNMITVLDREGRIASQSIGLDADAGDVVQSVKRLLVP